MWIFDEFVACGFPFRYCSFEKSVIRLVSFRVVIDSSGGVSVLGDVAFFCLSSVGFFEDCLHIPGKDD